MKKTDTKAMITVIACQALCGLALLFPRWEVRGTDKIFQRILEAPGPFLGRGFIFTGPDTQAILKRRSDRDAEYVAIYYSTTHIRLDLAVAEMTLIAIGGGLAFGIIVLGQRFS